MVHMMSLIATAVLGFGGFIGILSNFDGGHVKIHASYGWGADCAIC